MTAVKATIEIAVPPERVWDVIMDPRRFGDWVTIRSELAMRVHEALVAACIEIPFPQRDIHIRSIATEARGSLATTVIDPADPDAPRNPAPPAAETPGS